MLPVDIHPLSPGRVDDYFRFFDGAAFADHPDWSWCYCTYYHFDRAYEQELQAQNQIQGKDDLRRIAARLIADGTLRGYLAYHENEVVGWCNAGPKESFRRLRSDADLWPDKDSVQSIVCFIIAAPYRRQGIARQLLQRVAEDAARQGVDCLEAYPVDAEPDAYDHFHGHISMYRACGFLPHKQTERYTVMRKPLSEQTKQTGALNERS